jgi:xanthine dehydrogenase YagS FAD-binding subunit
MPFDLVDAHSAAEAAALLRRYAPGARPIATGGDLLGLMKEGVAGPTLAMPSVLVNLATAPDLAEIVRNGSELRLGAMTTLIQLRQMKDLPPILGEAIERIASPQLRARTTLGGNLLQRPRCLYFRHPDITCFKKGQSGCPAREGPAEAYAGALFPGICHAGHPSDLAPVLIALDAAAEIVSADSTRRLSLSELYRDAARNPGGETQLAPDELLSAIMLPERPKLQAFEKIAPRASNEFSWASAAVAITGTAGIIAGVRIALGGIAPGPYQCERAPELLLGKRFGEVDAKAIASELIPSQRLSTVLHPRAAAAQLAIERALSRAVNGARLA